MQLIPLEQRYAAHRRIALLLPRNRERDPNLPALAAACRMVGRRPLGQELFPQG
jgi:LysR family malonate utilization transcriptional regulator